MSAITLATDWSHFSDDDPADDPVQGGGENGDFAEFAPIDWSANSPSSPNSPALHAQAAVLPPDSILSRWFDYARQRTEGADCYLAGSILPVAGALLGRRVWTPLGGGRKYPNLFTLICGKPGDRKSTTIRLAEAIARQCLPAHAFLPNSFSPESLFDEYDTASGGLPDKLWIVGEGNSVLTDWQKTNNGERNAARFLELYDCEPLSESFRRNKPAAEDGNARRTVSETSTNVVFGATFNVACFQGQSVRTGMARRFLYYVAERRGCNLFDPAPADAMALEPIVQGFRRCLDLEGPMALAPEAAPLWIEYQTHNRQLMDAADSFAEALVARLSSAPAQVLAVAMIFQAAIWAERTIAWNSLISREALDGAIAHVDTCLAAADLLDEMTHRVATAEEAEILFERIVHDYGGHRRGNSIYVRRGHLTRSYCHNTLRRGSLRPRDLYYRLIPYLIQQNRARLAVKEGRLEVYAFRVEG